jgi:hypothetical protein
MSLANAPLSKPELAFTLCDAALLERLAGLPSPLNAEACLAALGWRESVLPQALAGRPLDRIHYGNEFCERLLPHSTQLRRVVEWSRGHDLGITLLTPMLADRGIEQLPRLFGQLPDASEVVVNDWGVLRLLRERFPRLCPVAGRQMGKMIKDPRLPSAEWASAIPPGMQSSLYPKLMQRFGVESVETDIRPFAETADLRPNGLRLSVHLPFGYTLKGRICKPGSLALEKQKKFMPGHSCQKECLVYFSRMQRTGCQSPHELSGFLRGNTIFYRYGVEQQRVLGEALRQGWINRLVLAGDWNENRCTD